MLYSEDFSLYFVSKMETLDGNSNSPSSSFGDDNNGTSNGSVGGVTLYGMRLPSVNPLRSPLSFLLDYSGILRNDSEAMIVNNGVSGSELRPQIRNQSVDVAASAAGSSAGEVAIRIIGAGEHDDHNHLGEMTGYDDDCGDDLMGERSGMPSLEDDDDTDGRGGIAADESVPLVSSSSSLAGSGQVDGDAAGNGVESNSRDSSAYQRYDIQLVAKWVEQILPFSLLLLVVFIRQHLQGITTLF